MSRQPVAVHGVAADLEASVTVVPHTWAPRYPSCRGGLAALVGVDAE